MVVLKFLRGLLENLGVERDKKGKKKK